MIPFSTPDYPVIGTRLLATTYEQLRADLHAASEQRSTLCIDFTNTHIVTARRHDPVFRALTEGFDAFVPDSMPLIWCLNAKGADLQDRVYGPAFFRYFLTRSPSTAKHYFLGGSPDCLRQLIKNVKSWNPHFCLAGSHHGYFQDTEEDLLISNILSASPDFLWIGLGTPKQQEWIMRHRESLQGMIVLAVGFAFDVNAGTKRDSPMWMQQMGLGWLFRLMTEPRRLLTRYIKYNSLFIYYLVCDLLSSRRA